ncbi:MAG: (Fe-S)-binding protein [Candidatus Heimdallarchaeota archaeon]
MELNTRYFTPNLDFRDKIITLSQNNLKYCYQCANCTGICPINIVSSFNPRELIHMAQLGIVPESENEVIWRCTTCAACEEFCPKKVKIIEIITAYRAHTVEEGGEMPYTYTQTLQSFFQTGNPFNLRSAARADWAKGLDVPVAEKGTEVMYFVGCTASYDPRSQKIAQAISSILKRMGVNFGIVGNKERECGNCINFMGETVLADYEREQNEALIKRVHPSTIITTSPHSFNRIKHAYNLPEGTEVLHYTQFLDRLIGEGTLEFPDNGHKEQLITYHDACYLGRHNGVYEEPRRVLRAVPGVKLVEMLENHQFSVCCGGGGGNIWAETRVEERLSLPRLKQALDVGASVLATACYFCLLMFDDAVKVGDVEKQIQAKDIAEIVKEAL